jgi:protein-tyrosine phosphatase
LIDWHCHILPGIDDGAVDLTESRQMARTLSASGFATVCCTPHLVKGVYERSAAEIRARVEALQVELNAESLPLRLLAGAEYYLDEYLLTLLDDPLPLGDTALLLLEIPSQTPAPLAEETCRQVKAKGYTPVIAHPERCSLLHLKQPEPTHTSFISSLFARYVTPPDAKLKNQDPKLLSTLLEIGCKFQGNLGSFAGIYGDKVRLRAEAFCQAGLYSHFGSDAHHAPHLEDFLLKGLQTIAAYDTP